MECVATTFASILVKESPANEFKFERGLRQEDPLSHFLYLLVAEGINVLMNGTMEVGLFTGTQMVDQIIYQFVICNLLMTLYCWEVRVGQMLNPRKLFLSFF